VVLPPCAHIQINVLALAFFSLQDKTVQFMFATSLLLASVMSHLFVLKYNTCSNAGPGVPSMHAGLHALW
jgi:hypothetical protein